MQKLSDIRALIRTERSPVYKAAESVFRGNDGKGPQGEKLLEKIWGKNYKKTKEWRDGEGTPSDDLVRSLCESFNNLRRSHPRVKAVTPNYLRLWPHGSLSAPTFYFARALGYKTQVTSDESWWETVERDINEVNMNAPSRAQTEDLSKADCNLAWRSLGRINYFYTHSYSDRRNENLVILRSVLRIKRPYPRDEKRDIYHIPVEAYVPETGGRNKETLIYSGKMYVVDGVCIINLFNSDYRDDLHMRVPTNAGGKFKEGFFMGKSIYGGLTVSGPLLLEPLEESYNSIEDTEEFMRSNCAIFPAKPNDKNIDQELSSKLNEWLSWEPKKT